MTLLLTILVIGYVAWRYRRVLGLGKRWDEFGRGHAADLATRLGWSDRKDAGRSARATSTAPVLARSTRRSIFPTLDNRRLPAALAAGAVETVVILALSLSGHSLLSFLVGAVVGPILGGIAARTLWWPLIAALVAIVVGAGKEFSPIVIAVPVAVFAYAGVRADIARWIARLNAEPDESS